MLLLHSSGYRFQWLVPWSTYNFSSCFQPVFGYVAQAAGFNLQPFLMFHKLWVGYTSSGQFFIEVNLILILIHNWYSMWQQILLLNLNILIHTIYLDILGLFFKVLKLNYVQLKLRKWYRLIEVNMKVLYCCFRDLFLSSRNWKWFFHVWSFTGYYLFWSSYINFSKWVSSTFSYWTFPWAATT